MKKLSVEFIITVKKISKKTCLNNRMIDKISIFVSNVVSIFKKSNIIK